MKHVTLGDFDDYNKTSIIPKNVRMGDVFVNPNGSLIKSEDGDNEECFDIPFIKVVQVFNVDAQFRAISLINKLL
jgi:hypothetical protein